MSRWDAFSLTPHMGPTHTAQLAIHAQRARCMVEFGSGGSTLFLAATLPRTGRLISCDHDPQWSQRVSLAIATCRGLGMDLIPVHLGLMPDAPASYVQIPAPFTQPDVVFVDGRHRAACVRWAWDHLPSRGVLLVHDAQREPPALWTGWDAPTQTTDPDWLENPTATLFIGRKP